MPASGAVGDMNARSRATARRYCRADSSVRPYSRIKDSTASSVRGEGGGETAVRAFRASSNSKWHTLDMRRAHATARMTSSLVKACGAGAYSVRAALVSHSSIIGTDSTDPRPSPAIAAQYPGQRRSAAASGMWMNSRLTTAARAGPSANEP